MCGEKAWRLLHKNAASNVERVLEAAPHKPPIPKAIQVRRTRHEGHCLRSRDELISNVVLWTPSKGRAKAGRPARNNIQELCVDKGCSSEDLPEVIDDKDGWRERVRDICADGTTWWWRWRIMYTVNGITAKLLFQIKWELTFRVKVRI